MANPIVNKRLLAEAVQALVKASAPDPGHLIAAVDALARVISDATDTDSVLLLLERAEAVPIVDAIRSAKK